MDPLALRGRSSHNSTRRYMKSAPRHQPGRRCPSCIALQLLNSSLRDNNIPGRMHPTRRSNRPSRRTSRSCTRRAPTALLLGSKCRSHTKRQSSRQRGSICRRDTRPWQPSVLSSCRRTQLHMVSKMTLPTGRRRPPRTRSAWRSTNQSGSKIHPCMDPSASRGRSSHNNTRRYMKWAQTCQPDRNFRSSIALQLLHSSLRDNNSPGRMHPTRRKDLWWRSTSQEHKARHSSDPELDSNGPPDMQLRRRLRRRTQPSCLASSRCSLRNNTICRCKHKIRAPMWCEIMTL